ncbi:uncharacterized protein [Fopius arisanus]|uniref:THAP9-like helix-turn-helix domain-containing protein n=1 Tax=Fopius arisanus TaxID=64838 RepID=A0A9R1SUG8_9HYME|nr:PREDICTED: uncharacterized protein LOC105263059 [Fopius arisanus]
MGKTNWMLKKWHVLCAEHFSKKSIDFHHSRARLRIGSVSTIFQHSKENLPLSPALEIIVHVNKLENSKRVTLFSLEVQKNLPFTLCGKLSDQCPKKSANIESISHDHSYGELGDVAQRKLKHARAKVEKLLRDKKKLQQKTNRHQERIQKFKAIITTLRAAGDLEDDYEYSLDGFNDITRELFQRVHDNAKTCKWSKEKYSPQLRCFALTLHFTIQQGPIIMFEKPLRQHYLATVFYVPAIVL